MTSKETTESSTLDAGQFKALGVIISRIAHDFNNLVTPLLAYPPLIRKDLAEGSQGHELLDILEKTAEDMVHINSQLLALSMRGKVERQTCSLNTIVNNLIASLTNESAMEGITIESDLAEDLVEINVSHDHVLSALQNLCHNATEAMEVGGRLVIKTKNVRLDSPRTSSCGLPIEAGNYVELSVTENGKGIPEEIRDRIFELFVSTKKGTSKRGAGLGLSIVHRIMTEYGGHIDCQSTPGKETTFTLRFPASAHNAVTSTSFNTSQDAGATEKNRVQTVTPRDKGRILIVDDEKAIQRTFKVILSYELPEHKIDVADNGAEAVEAFGPEHHALLIMDLHMPVMSGQAAFSKIEQICKSRNWEMPSIVFCTGFAHPDMVKRVVDTNPLHCLLSKPVTSQTLLETVKSRL